MKFGDQGRFSRGFSLCRRQSGKVARGKVLDFGLRIADFLTDDAEKTVLFSIVSYEEIRIERLG